MVLIKTIDNTTKQETFEVQDMNISYRITKEQAKTIENNTVKKFGGNLINTGEDTLIIDYLDVINLQYAKDNVKNVIRNAGGWFNMMTGETGGNF